MKIYGKTSMKQLAKKCLLATPGINVLTLKLHFLCKQSRASDEVLVGLICRGAHSIDHRLSRGEAVPKSKIIRMRLLFAEFGQRGLLLSDEVEWAMTILAIAVTRTHVNYMKTLQLSITEGTEVSRGSDKQMSLWQAICDRRSVRSWLDRSVTEQVVNRLIDAARWAPSSCNGQPCRIIRISNSLDKQALALLYSGHNTFWTMAPVVLMVLIQRATYTEAQRHYAYLDAGAFIQNLLLQAHAEGLGCCWIGFSRWSIFDKLALIPESQKLYDHFCIDKELVPVSLIAIGYPRVKPKTPKRLEPERIVLSGR